MTKGAHREKRPIEELIAASTFRDSLVERADAPGHYPMWHGWVIVDAFLAGIDYARSHPAPLPAEAKADGDDGAVRATR